MNQLHLLHFLDQSSLLLVSQEAIFDRPKYFFTKKTEVPTESNWCFGLVITGESGKGLGVVIQAVKMLYVCMYVSGRWPNVEGKPATANDWITCNFKPLRSHTFVNFLFQKKLSSCCLNETIVQIESIDRQSKQMALMTVYFGILYVRMPLMFIITRRTCYQYVANLTFMQ